MELERRHFDIIDSTNTWAKQNAHLLARDKVTLVTAEGQTAGHGRFKRKWESPPGENIYASFCFFVDKDRHDVGNIAQIMSLATISILEKLNFAPQIKWPNDILISKKKVAGILTETTRIDDQLCVIIGIGLNINMSLEFLKLVSCPATSLLAERGHPFDIEDVLYQLRNRFLADLKLFMQGGFASFLGTYRHYATLNQEIRFHDNKTIWEGKLHAIQPDGSLVLKLADNTVKNFQVGEILWDKC